MEFTARMHRDRWGTRPRTDASGCTIATWNSCSACCGRATWFKFAARATSRLRPCLEVGTTRPWLASRLPNKTAGSSGLIENFEVSGGHYANGNHIHGSRGRNGLFTGGSAAGRRADLRAGVPPVLCVEQAGAASGRGEFGKFSSKTGMNTLTLRRYVKSL